MSSSPFPRGRPPSPFFRHRPLGRAPSPPTWACYEQIHAVAYDTDSDSDGSFSVPSDRSDSDEDSSLPSLGCGNDAAEVDVMDLGEERDGAEGKGKGKAAVRTEKVKVREHTHKDRRRHQPAVALRPILTIQRSQGFVWNQVRTFAIVHAWLV
jgi:hypothetical protein